MLQVLESATLKEASEDLREFALNPANWVTLGTENRQSQDPAYQRRVGSLRICASVHVLPTLKSMVRISFRAPDLSPMKAADYLEDFVRGWIVLAPNSEWHVEVDARRWIHFARPYTESVLAA